MESLILMLLIWIQENTEYRVDLTSRPQVSHVSNDTLEKIFIKHYVRVNGKNPPKILLNNRALFLHIPEVVDGVSYKGILFREDIDPLKDMFSKDTLLHELVHFVQYENDKHERVACESVLEAEAYNLDSKFLLEQGLSKDSQYYRNIRLYAILSRRCTGPHDLD